MKLNNINLVDRNNRPSVDSKVAIRAMFMNDGEYVDPSYIRDVMIFKRTVDVSPSSILDTTTNLVSQEYSSYIGAYFSVSAGAAYDPSTYPSIASAGIYKIRSGDYVCVLDGIDGVSSVNNVWGTETTITNTCSSTGEYFDVWTVIFPGQSDYKVVINSFELYNDTFVTVTEPLMVRTQHELSTKKIVLGSKTDVKITSVFTIENKAIDQSIKNLFKANIAVDPQLEIVKINEDKNLPSRVEVSGFSDTSSLINVTSKNTFIFNWDTDALRTHPQMLLGNFGPMTGVYYVRIKYTLLNETILSQPMWLQIT